MLLPIHLADERPILYATASDFCRAFSEELHGLYLLSFLLTADNDKAEECFVNAIGECGDGIGLHGVGFFMGPAHDSQARNPVDQACRRAPR